MLLPYICNIQCAVVAGYCFDIVFVYSFKSMELLDHTPLIDEEVANSLENSV